MCLLDVENDVCMFCVFIVCGVIVWLILCVDGVYRAFARRDVAVLVSGRATFCFVCIV